MLRTIAGCYNLFVALFSYIIGVVMKKTDHRPNTNGWDFIIITWTMGALAAYAGIAILFPGLLPL